MNDEINKLKAAAAKVSQIRADIKAFDGDKRGMLSALEDATDEYHELACRFPILALIERAEAAERTSSAGSAVVMSDREAFQKYHNRHVRDGGFVDAETYFSAGADYARRAAQPVQEPPSQQPVAWSVTYNGEHCFNLYRTEAYAEEAMALFNQKYPEGKRTIMPLYAAAQAPALPDLNEELVEILGRPNFTCIRIAQRLRQMGRDIPTKAEYEQAHTIHLLLSMYFEHGKEWAEKANDFLNAGNEASAAMSSEGGANG